MTLRRKTSLSVLISLAISGQAFAGTFWDTDDSPYQEAIRTLSERHILQGYADGSYRPDATVNRAEFLKILMDARFPSREPRDIQCFKDLEVRVPQWYARTTCSAREMGIVQGYPDGTFKPEQPVQFVEALKMAFLSFGITPKVTEGRWYEPYLMEARSRGLLTHLLQSPAHELKRGEMAALTLALVFASEQSDIPAAFAPVCGNGVQEVYEQCDDGNTQDGDGCSSICINVPEPLRHAILNVSQQSTGSFSAIAQGQKQVALLKFTATAGRQDALLTSVSFRPTVGSLLYGKNYQLAMDRNGDGVYETIAQSQGKSEAGRLVFDAMENGGVFLPESLTVSFVVLADLVVGLGPVSIGLQFATDLPDYIQAQGNTDGTGLEGVETDGICTANNCFIRVNTQGGTNINIQTRGNLYVTEDPVSVRNTILLGGSTSDALLRLRFHADGENIDVRSLRIDGIGSSVDSLLLYKLSPGESFDPNRMTPFAQASNGQCSGQVATRFCTNLSMGSLVITPQTETVVVVSARMKTKQLGGVSGQVMTPYLSSSRDAGSEALLARGVFSSQELMQNNGDGFATGEIFIGISTPAANIQMTGKNSDTSFGSIGSILRDGPAQESYIPSAFVPIGAFTVHALPHSNNFQGSHDVIMKTMTFHITAQNVQIDPLSYTLTTKDFPGVSVPCSASATTGNFDVTCAGIQNGPIQFRIPQGQFVTYRLSANVTNTQMSPGTSILTTSLAILGQRNQTNSVLWSDEATTFSWVNIPESSVQGTIYQN